MSLINPDHMLFEEISALIEQGRREIMSQASRGTVLIFWQIGNRINSEILDNKRADYGKQIVSRLATQLNWTHFVEILPLKRQEAKLFYNCYLKRLVAVELKQGPFKYEYNGQMKIH